MKPEFIRGSGGGKSSGGGSSPVEAPNTLQSNSLARIIDLISEGPVDGLVNGAKSIYFNNTPLENSDETYNFSGVVWDTRIGLPDQSPLIGNSDVESETVVGADVKFSLPVVSTATNVNNTALRVKIRVPQLTSLNTGTGNLNGSSVALTVEIKSSESGWQTMVSDSITGKTTSMYERAYNIPLFGTAPWQIRVNRLTQDSESATISNTINFYSFTEIIDHKLIYPDSAIVGIAADAQRFGNSLPSRAYEIDGINCKVPSNYDANAGTYSGIWDGTFKLSWTNNPAWILYDILTSKRYGIGDSIDSSQIDKWSLYEIGQYCDEIVDDGFGGTEPRYTFNGVIQSRAEAFKVIQVIASAFRGMTYWGSGSVTAVADKPADAVKLVTPANVIDGKFEYQGTALKARHTVAYVTWNNPQDLYLPAVEVVEDVDGIERYGIRQQDISAIGCTSRGLARRLGRWLLDSEATETELVTYQASFDHADVVPGNIIKIADPAYSGYRFGGRSLSYSGSTLVIDSPVTLSVGQTYTVSVVLPDGSLETKNVTNGAGSTSSLVLNSPLSQTPIGGAVWVITGTDVAPRNFRVLAVQEVAKNIFTITALFYDSTKYDRIERNLVVEAPSYTAIPSGPLGVPINLALIEGLDRSTGVPVPAVTFSWTAPSDPRVTTFEVSYLQPGSSVWQTADTTTTTLYQITDTFAGDWQFRVRSIGSIYHSDWSTISATLLALRAPLTPRVTGLEIVDSGPDGTFGGRDALFRWREGSSYSYGLNNPNGADAAYRDPFFAGYYLEVRTITGTLLRATTVLDPTFTYTFEMNQTDSMGILGDYPQRSFTLTVQQKGQQAQEVSYSTPQTIVATNPAPVVPVDLNIRAQISEVWVTYTPPSDADWEGTVVWASQTSGFDPATTEPLYIGAGNIAMLALSDDADWYIRMASYDAFGSLTQNLNLSQEYHVHTSSVTSLVNISQFTFSGLVFTPNVSGVEIDWSAATATASVGSVSHSYSISSGSAPWVSGTVYVYYINGETVLRYSTTIASAVGNDRVVVATYHGGNDVTVGNGKAYLDGSYVIAGTIGASQLVTGTAVITQTAQIANAIVDTANIKNLAVTSAQINDVNASKITTGTVNVLLTLGVAGKILLDGTNNRMVVSD